MLEFIKNVKKWFKDGILEIKEKADSNSLLVGFCVGIILTRIVDGNNVIGAIAAGVAISFITMVGYKVFKK